MRLISYGCCFQDTGIEYTARAQFSPVHEKLLNGRALLLVRRRQSRVATGTKVDMSLVASPTLAPVAGSLLPRPPLSSV